MSKGINGTAGTMSAALLALGVHWAATKSGHRFEPVVASGSVFLLGTQSSTPTKSNPSHARVQR